MNHNLREVIDSIGTAYRYVGIDNEAGMEHLSRRTTRDVQHMLVVTDPTQRGIVAAERIAAMRHELDIEIENAYLIVNRLRGDMPEALAARIAAARGRANAEHARLPGFLWRVGALPELA